MKCVLNISLLFIIEDIKRLWFGGGYYGAQCQDHYIRVYRLDII